MICEIIPGRVLADSDGENGGNFGAIILENEILFIDSGMYHYVTARVKERLYKQYRRPITKLLITHYHSDHVLGAQAFAPATIISTKQTREILDRSMPTPRELKEWAEQNREEKPELWRAAQDFSPRRPDLTFEGRIVLGEEQDIEMKHTGGHTAGSAVVIDRSENVCFCGDLIFNGSFPYAGDTTCDPREWIFALEELYRAGYDKIIPGHGSVCDSTVIQKHIDFFRELAERVKENIGEGLSIDEFISKGLLPEYYPDEGGQRTRSTLERWFQYYGDEKV